MASRKKIPPPLAEEMPPFDPSVWADKDVDATTNCFAFAADDPHGHLNTYGPQPGDRNFQYLRDISVKEITRKVQSDKFQPIGDDPRQKAGHYLVYLAVAPGNDYHWYRQMPDGTWWHKPAPGKPITNRDYDGKVITDPRTAHRRNKRYHYEKGGGFFHVPYGGVRVGITADRRWLKEFELQEVVELVDCQRKDREEEGARAVKRHNQEFRQKRAAIKGAEPKTDFGHLLRRALHRAEDMLDKLRGRPPRERLSVEGRLEALREELATRSRQADRQRRRTEVRELRDLISRQEERAEKGFRPTEEAVRLRIGLQKGQRHSFVVANDVAEGDITWTELTVEGEPARRKDMRSTTALDTALKDTPGVGVGAEPFVPTAGCLDDLLERAGASEVRHKSTDRPGP